MIPTQSTAKDSKYVPFGLWHHIIKDESSEIVYDMITEHYQDYAVTLSCYGYLYILNPKKLNEAFGL